MNGSHLFPIYKTDNPSPIYKFDYDKIDALEVQALSILDAFQVMRFKDLMNMVDDQKQVLKYMGNINTPFIILQIIPLCSFYGFSFFFYSAKMTNVNLKEQRKLMGEARARQGEQSSLKSDQVDIQTRAPKKRKIDAKRASPGISEPQYSLLPPPKNPQPSSPKKMKTLVGDHVSHADLAITYLVQETESIQ